MNHSLKVVLAVGILFCTFGVYYGIRGELKARNWENRRQIILATYPSKIAKAEQELRDASLSQEEREEIESNLMRYRSGVTGIPPYFSYNARLGGYGLGGTLVIIGLLCIVYPLMNLGKRAKSL